VVLSEDPRTEPLDRLARIVVAMVLVGGSSEVCAPGYEALCPDLPFVAVRDIRVRASHTIASHPVRAALDDDTTTWWSSGDLPPQRLEIDLREERTLNAIELIVAQDSTGHTTHRVWGKGGEPGEGYVLPHTFSGVTADLDALQHSFVPAISGIRYLMIETTEGASSVAWREVMINGS
jgi:hypothetical protein